LSWSQRPHNTLFLPPPPSAAFNGVVAWDGSIWGVGVSGGTQAGGGWGSEWRHGSGHATAMHPYPGSDAPGAFGVSGGPQYMPYAGYSSSGGGSGVDGAGMHATGPGRPLSVDGGGGGGLVSRAVGTAGTQVGGSWATASAMAAAEASGHAVGGRGHGFGFPGPRGVPQPSYEYVTGMPPAGVPSRVDGGGGPPRGPPGTLHPHPRWPGPVGGGEASGAAGAAHVALWYPGPPGHAHAAHRGGPGATSSGWPVAAAGGPPPSGWPHYPASAVAGGHAAWPHPGPGVATGVAARHSGYAGPEAAMWHIATAAPVGGASARPAARPPHPRPW